MTDPVYRTGHFVWRELMTSDTAASLRFYGEVLGWKSDAVKMPDGTEYNMLKAGETPVAAVVLRAGVSATAEELRAWLNANVAAQYQRVARVLIYEDFPRNAAGKTLKREMRAAFWEGRDTKL